VKIIFFKSPELRRIGFVCLCGLLLALAFPKFNLWWLAWLAPGWLLLVSLGQTGWTAFRTGYVAGLAQFLVGFYWLLLIPKPVIAIVAWLAVGFLMAIYIGAWTWVCCRFFPKNARAEKRPDQPTSPVDLLLSVNWQRRAWWAFICAVAWVAMEMGVARILNGFPYSLGISQFKLLPLIQIASVTGVHGVSFLVVWVSVSLVCVGVVAWRGRVSFPLLARELAAPCVVLAAVIFFGSARLNFSETPRGYLKVALVQPGIPQSVIWDVNERTNRLHKLVELSEAALAQRPDLLIWPEAALPENMVGRNRETQDLITALVRSNNVWMIFGGIDTAVRRDASGATETIKLNAAFLVDPAGDLVSRYFKRKLVMFGEYVPGARRFPFLQRLFKKMGGMEAGQKIIQFQMSRPEARITPLICFEDTFPRLAREAVDSDTDFLLNLTNNGWFGSSAAQWQHAVDALFRAVENGVPLVRCTNNGLTCWIDSRGRLHAAHFPGSTDIYQAGFKNIEVPLRGSQDTQRGRTIYHRCGDLFGWVCVALTLAALAQSFLSKQRKKS
jgi:apolipoprotein N-acyltransferase